MTDIRAVLEALYAEAHYRPDPQWPAGYRVGLLDGIAKCLSALDALAAASPEPERCATCGQSRDGLKHRCWSTHFRRVREAGDGLHVTTDCHPFQSAPAAPTVEALRDALLDDIEMWYPGEAIFDGGLRKALDAIIAAARADERTRQKP